MVRLLALTLLVTALSAEEARGGGAGWRMPLAGEVEVARGFRVTPGAPYSAGQRRGVDLAAPPGAVVRSACTGRVSFAGRVPGGGGALGVSVRCGRMTATHLGLRSLRVARGKAVAAGRPLGVLGSAGTLRLGARITPRRFGYVDPLGLMGGGSAPPVLPLGRAPRPRGNPKLAQPRRLPAPARRPARAPVAAPAPAGVPLAAWFGVVLLAGGVGCGALVRRRSRRSAAVRGLAREGA